MKITGNLIDIHQRTIKGAEVHIHDGIISSIIPSEETFDKYILPGFVDAHVHIESSMLTPAAFAQIAVLHGSVASVSDPHEIANVLGVDGVNYMIKNGDQVPFKFHFGAPSCVPATSFETAGANIDPKGIELLLQKDEVLYLAEMMNYPGVIFEDKEVMAKLHLARQIGKPVDGHAPGLRGEKLKKYVSAGISTDHECFTYEEAKEKLEMGMKIIIREGSAARNFEALIPLLREFPDKIMFCSDDKHPDDLIKGHINQLVTRAIKAGYNLFDVLRAASLNPISHYGLEVGLLKQGDPADFILIDNPQNFNILSTFIDGDCVMEAGKNRIPTFSSNIVNQFSRSLTQAEDFTVEAKGPNLRVIEAINGELITRQYLTSTSIKDGFIQNKPEEDVLKLAVVNRYQDTPPAVAFIKNFGIKNGAIASSVAHDSHNILVVGSDDEWISKAINLVIEQQGGICAVNEKEEKILALPIAGIISEKDAYSVGAAYQELDSMAKAMGSKLDAPFMTLSFMALLVIPSLKLSDKGLFDGDKFEFVSLSY